MTNQKRSDASELSLVPINADIDSLATNKNEYDGGFSLLGPKNTALSPEGAAFRDEVGKRNNFQKFTFG